VPFTEFVECSARLKTVPFPIQRLPHEMGFDFVHRLSRQLMAGR